MPKAGTRAPQRQRRLLAVVVHEHAVTAVERALGHGVEQPEGRDDRARRQHLDLEVAARHVVDLLGEVERVLVEDVLLRPRALPAHGDGPLRLGDHREAEGGGAGRRHGGPGQELATRRLGGWLRSVHVPILLNEGLRRAPGAIRGQTTAKIRAASHFCQVYWRISGAGRVRLTWPPSRRTVSCSGRSDPDLSQGLPGRVASQNRLLVDLQQHVAHLEPGLLGRAALGHEGHRRCAGRRARFAPGGRLRLLQDETELGGHAFPGDAPRHGHQPDRERPAPFAAQDGEPNVAVDGGPRDQPLEQARVGHRPPLERRPRCRRSASRPGPPACPP